MSQFVVALSMQVTFAMVNYGSLSLKRKNIPAQKRAIKLINLFASGRNRAGKIVGNYWENFYACICFLCSSSKLQGCA